jgi:inner membrane protein
MIQTLKWISNRFYTISKKNGTLYFNDMRYGQINGRYKGDSEFIFSFRIEEPKENNGDFTAITRERGSFKIDRYLLVNFFNRIKGSF